MTYKARIGAFLIIGFCGFGVNAGLVTDIDGNSYKTALIGEHRWFLENLRVSRYRNGDDIPAVVSNEEWLNTLAGARTANNDKPDFVETFGYLYNWYAVEDSRGICPEGWVVPSDEDWRGLENALQLERRRIGPVELVVGSASLVEGRSGWWGNWSESESLGSSGFGIVPAGSRFGNNDPNFAFGNTLGSFSGGDGDAFLWTSDVDISNEPRPDRASARIIFAGNENFISVPALKRTGGSIRCISR